MERVEGRGAGSARASLTAIMRELRGWGKVQGARRVAEEALRKGVWPGVECGVEVSEEEEEEGEEEEEPEVEGGEKRE